MPDRTDADALTAAVVRGMAGYPASRKCLIAISGGRDSVALLDILIRSGRNNLVVVHVNHQLRGRASGGDAAFVRKLAAKYGLPVMVAMADTRGYAEARGVSLELAARELRMVAFSAVSKRYRTTHLVTAHHAEDQAETCLFNYLRGTGAAGLAGMQQVSSIQAGDRELTVHRPMLAIRRREIDVYVQSAGLAFREDASNASLEFTRNRIRHELMPLVKEIMGDRAIDAILRNAEILRGEHAVMADLAAAHALDEVFSVDLVRAVPLALQRRMVHAWLAQFGPGECGFAEVELVLSLVPKGAAVAKINLPRGFHCRRTAGRIFLQSPLFSGLRADT
jgi:tRNA(Ile)-lysidine synthase